MRIGIDVSAVVYGTGVSVYTRNLVQTLLNIDKKNEYVLFGGSLRRGHGIKQFFGTLPSDSFKGRVLPIPPTVADFVWNRVHRLKIEKLIGSVDVFHSSDWTQPPSKSFRVTTIHDLAPIFYPKLSHPRIVSVHKARLKWVIREVDRVIVPSKTTASDVENLGIKHEKIRMVPEAVDPIYKKAAAVNHINQVRNKYGIKGSYLLAVGVNERKNTIRIIDAYKQIKKQIGLKLVVVGYTHSAISETDGIFFTGHVLDEEMPSLYRGAEALVYPSLYEGFGLPILEAFSSETPVVTSNLGSMAEVSGGAAVLVDPYHSESIAEGIKTAMKNPQKYVKKGREIVSKYSWLTAAKATLDVYKESL